MSIIFVILFQNDADSSSVYDIDIDTIKQADQAIFMIIFVLTVFSFLAHVIFAFRYRYSWHRLSISVKYFISFYYFLMDICHVLDSFLMCYLCIGSIRYISSSCCKQNKIEIKNIFFIMIQCWEDKLRKRFTSTYLNNQFLSTSNGPIKPQTGSAAAAAVGFFFRIPH